MATEIVDRLENNSENVPSQTVVTSSIVIPSTSIVRSGRQDSLPKRRASGDLSRQSTEESKRPRLDTKDAEVKKRGQRLFGVINGTLTKFKNESQNKTEAEIKRDQIVQKTQEKLKKDHEELVNQMKTEEQERRERIAREKREAEERRNRELKRQIVLESTSSISHDIMVTGEVRNDSRDVEMTEHNDSEKHTEALKQNEVETDRPEVKKESIKNDDSAQSTLATERMAVDEERSAVIKIEESVIKDEPTDSKDDPVEY
ncbi:9443_t:CDS:2 [Acaulospora colombiana]|uniref:9443_t:CDS:1 n=1 Tax=Acaulospora colombiana TaxID=27376 RepID=A0ACA9K9I1_9GLOM|nr:9443_t:CDS:2 [Acaulospora colombiana]